MFFSASDIMKAVRGRFCYYGIIKGCVIQESYCCTVGIGQQAQCNRLDFSVLRTKEIGDEEPCYSTKILIFSFIWAGLAALLKAINIMKVVQS